MLEDAILRYGYWVLFLGTTIEGEATFVTAAFLAHRGYLNIYMVFAVAVAANVISTQLFYIIGKWKGHASLEAQAATQPKLARAYNWVKGHSAWLMVASRFMFGFRIAIPAACGAVGMGVSLFTFWNFVGAIIWGVAFIAVGYGAGSILERIMHEVKTVDKPLAIGIFFLLLAALAIVRDWRAARELRTPEELALDSTVRVAEHEMPPNGNGNGNGNGH